MGEITFIRHGQASYGAANYDKLSPLGHLQAEWLGHHLKVSGHRFDRIVCGTLRRHRETLAGIQQSLNHETVAEDARLNEMSFFALERAFEAYTGELLPLGQAAAARNFSRVMAAWEADEIPDVDEQYGDFRSRILAAVADHSREGEHLLVVSSGGPVGVTIREVLGLDLAAMTNVILRTYNASYSRFAILDGQRHLVQFNGVAHLETADRRHALTYL